MRHDLQRLPLENIPRKKRNQGKSKQESLLRYDILLRTSWLFLALLRPGNFCLAVRLFGLFTLYDRSRLTLARFANLSCPPVFKSACTFSLPASLVLPVPRIRLYLFPSVPLVGLYLLCPCTYIVRRDLLAFCTSRSSCVGTLG